jgi:sugar O-acyltransferase (sialic acid O-acetyltransferase NeuD family)
MLDLLLFPCNGNAVEALDCLCDDFRAVGFIDDDPKKMGTIVLGLPVWDRRAITDFPSARILAVPGSPRSFTRRAEHIASLGIARERFATLVHPRAMVSRNATIGANVLIMAGTVITSNAHVEDHVLVLPNSVIHHDSRIGSYTILGAGVLVAGNVDIGERCYVGGGARFRDNITVAAETLIGLGATVVRSIDEPGGIWVGHPARCTRPKPVV